jgi:acyl-CoA thioester hydrolase
MKTTPLSHEIEMIVPFHDLDPMQIVWHGNYFKYFDQARFALFHQVGIDLYRYFQETRILFPVIKTATKYVVPLRYRDAFCCRATVAEATAKIVIDFEIRLAGGNDVCTRARSEQVAVRYPQMEMEFQIPDDIRTALGWGT